MMKRVFFSAVALGALASIPAPAAATPSSAAVYEAGRCLVQQDRRSAVALMGSLPLDDSPADLSSVGRGGAACVRGLAGAPAMLVRGGIAQALFMRDFGGFGRELRNDRNIFDLHLPVEATFGTPRDRTTQLYRWADCVVRNDSAGTERLLRAGIGTPAERDAVAGLQTFMSSCMPVGTQLSIRAWEVRSLFAQSAYHTLFRYWTGQLESARH
ncbi:MAG: hypothetical protein QOH47_347 [Sphingomonadales bacterium]|nr:hypothetical protein [Sphingomonadales bacterium]